MPGLGDTTAMLARLRRQTEAMSGLAGLAGLGDAAAGLEETAQFGRNPGALRMLSHVPQDLPAGAPLVVVLHGCTQRAGAYAEGAGWLTLADRHGFAVLAPEQAPANNFNRCFNWYEPADAGRGKGEAASIRAMVAHMVETHRLDSRRVFVTGLSAGGAMTSVMLSAYPEVFAGGGIVAGLPYGVADNLQEALGAMFGRAARAGGVSAQLRKPLPAGRRLPRVSIWHGDADATVRPGNAVDIAAQWALAHGLPARPTAIERLAGRTRAVWRGPDGEVLIESNLLAGMDHGAPLATQGPDGAGRAGPYLIEAGVSSSLEMLDFWGIAAARAKPAPRPAAQPKPKAKAQAEGKAAHPRRPAAPRPRPQPEAASLGGGVLKSVAAHVPKAVQDVIEKALRKAGLMG